MLRLMGVIAMAAFAAGCSDRGEPAAAPAAPAPKGITTADTGGRDLALTRAVLRQGEPTPITREGPSGLEPGTIRISRLDVTVLNATDVAVVDPSITCILENGEFDSSGSFNISGTVPAHGELTVTDQNTGVSVDPGQQVLCGVEAVFDPRRMTDRGPAQPLPGSIEVHLIESEPAA